MLRPERVANHGGGGGGARPTPRTAAAVWRLRRVDLLAPRGAPRSASAGDWPPAPEGGEAPLRPKAQAQAPPKADVTSSASSSGAGSSSSGGGGGTYSEYYKLQNTTLHPAAGGGRSSSGGGASTSGRAGAASAAAPPPAQHAPGDEAHSTGVNGGGNGGAPTTTSTTPPPTTHQQPSAVEEAMRKAQAALTAAEVELSAVEQMRSARVAFGPNLLLLQGGEDDGWPPPRLAAALALARRAAALAALALALVASHAFGLAGQWVGAAALAAGAAAWGLQRGALSPSGAAAAAAVGVVTLGCSLRLGATLLSFFVASSLLTSYQAAAKADLDADAKLGGQRDWRQVLCNAGAPAALAAAYGALSGCLDLPLGPLLPPGAVAPWRERALTALAGAFMGYYACCCGDTWASELGPLSPAAPRLITTLQPVRRGTNGGVTLLGLTASAAGGLFVGAVFYAAAVVSPTLWVLGLQRQAAQAQWLLLPLGLVAGLLGSLLDSLLGATLQFSGYDRAAGRITSTPGPTVTRVAGRPLLSNNAVNVLSASVTAALTALAALRTFG